MKDQPLLPKLLSLFVVALALGAGLFLFAEWCEELLISRRLHQRLESLHRYHLAGMNVRPELMADPPEQDSAAQRQPAPQLTIVWSGKTETLGRFEGAVRHPVYALRMEVVQWHGLSKKQRLGCVHITSGELAVQSRFSETVPPLCSEVAEAFSPPPAQGGGELLVVRD
ncbi:MAG: hypothetical protein WBN89_07610 [Prochlorococcaceae cyanobacterium]